MTEALRLLPARETVPTDVEALRTDIDAGLTQLDAGQHLTADDELFRDVRTLGRLRRQG